MPVQADADSYQNSNVLDLPAPASFEPDPIEKHIDHLLLDGPNSPLLDSLVDLLVEFTDGTATNPRAPKSFCNVLYTTNGNTGQIHFD